MSPSTDAVMIRVRDGRSEAAARCVAEETPVAIVHDASTYAVMMATPEDLEDFAIGLA
jgi:FdhD protein